MLVPKTQPIKTKQSLTQKFKYGLYSANKLQANDINIPLHLQEQYQDEYEYDQEKRLKNQENKQINKAFNYNQYPGLNWGKNQNNIRTPQNSGRTYTLLPNFITSKNGTSQEKNDNKELQKDKNEYLNKNQHLKEQILRNKQRRQSLNSDFLQKREIRNQIRKQSQQYQGIMGVNGGNQYPDFLNSSQNYRGIEKQQSQDYVGDLPRRGSIRGIEDQLAMHKFQQNNNLIKNNIQMQPNNFNQQMGINQEQFKRKGQNRSMTSHGYIPTRFQNQDTQQQYNGRQDQKKYSILQGGTQPKFNQKQFQFYYEKVNNGFYFQNQDEPIENLQQNQTIQQIDAVKGMDLKLKSRQKIIRLRKNNRRIIPSIVSININEPGQQKFVRPYLDLVIIVDCGLSMKGKKLGLCREIIFQLFEVLGQNDRICLIKMDDNSTILNPLLCNSKENQPHLRKLTYQYFSKCSKGDKDFISAFNDAFSILEKKRYNNNKTQILLISDGICGKELDKSQIHITEQQKQLQKFGCNFQISSLGIYKDANDQFLQAISLEQGGYYQKLCHSYEYFQGVETILQDVIEIVASDITINIEMKQNKYPFDKLELRRVYGYEWKKISETQFQIKIKNLYRGVSRIFAFDMCLPPLQYNLSESEKNQILMKCRLSGNCQNNNILSNDTQLVMSFVNEFETCDKIKEDSEVMEIYFYKKMRDAIQTSIDLMFRGEQIQGFENLTLSISEIRQHIESSNIKQIQSEYIMRELTEVYSLFQKK